MRIQAQGPREYSAYGRGMQAQWACNAGRDRQSQQQKVGHQAGLPAMATDLGTHAPCLSPPHRLLTPTARAVATGGYFLTRGSDQVILQPWANTPSRMHGVLSSKLSELKILKQKKSCFWPRVHPNHSLSSHMLVKCEASQEGWCCCCLAHGASIARHGRME